MSRYGYLVVFQGVPWNLRKRELIVASLEIDHEISFTVILPLLLIQEGQLSVTVESMYTSTG